MASPHKMPAAAAVLRGADKKNPQRYRESKAVDKAIGQLPPIGDPPEWLEPAAVVIWHELVKTIPAVILTENEREPFALLCRLSADMRANLMKQTFATKKLATVIQLYAHFGMTPVTRGKVSINSPDKPKNDDPFAEFGNTH